ncbi:MAG: hypothetical protein RBR70_10430 [Arcobacter sp.]|jgi:hypothetical protein|uniref:hypothetical protein n=1 Tax=Arcobacter sp. TaxID=1872629 RepID=UPI002A748277|nr:hypothetical protein [Arcobacter sp.]MDY3205475.1 hypothetical protein [Arcobacter sp.]
MENEILNLLLETLKIQAEKYKIIVNDDSLTHEQRKEFDTEITQMYNVLANLSNSSTIYTLAELKGLKAQYDVKFAEFDEKVANLDLSHLLVSFDSLTQEQKDSLKGQNGLNGNDGVDGQNGLSAYEIAKNNGFEGSELEWLESLKGQNGLNGNDGVDGQNGLSAFEIAVNNGFVGTAVEWLESLKGADGQDAESAIFDFDTLDTIQKEKISNYILEMFDISSILSRIEALESSMNVVPFEDNYNNFYEPDNYQQTMSKHDVVYDSTNESQTQLLEHYYMTNLVLVSEQLYKISFVLRFKHYIIESSANVVYDSSQDLFLITEQTPAITLDNYTFNPLINISKLDKKLLVGFSLVDNQTGETPQGLFEFGAHIESNVSFNSVYFEENTEVIDGFNYWVTNQL